MTYIKANDLIILVPTYSSPPAACCVLRRHKCTMQPTNQHYDGDGGGAGASTEIDKQNESNNKQPHTECSIGTSNAKIAVSHTV